MDVQSAARRWAVTWQRAWPMKQSEPFAALYHEAVERQFAVEAAVECRFAEPIAMGDGAAVEWWASFIEASQAITLAGVTVLRFDAEGLVVDHVDYWVQSQGRMAPYAGWGG